jgi:hypothetical protein
LNQTSTFQIITFFKNVEKRRKDLKDSAWASLLLTSLSCIKKITEIKDISASENRLWLKLDKHFF